MAADKIRNASDNCKMMTVISELFKKMKRTDKYIEGKRVVPDEYMRNSFNSFQTTCKIFKPGTQQDSQEGLVTFITNIELCDKKFIESIIHTLESTQYCDGKAQDRPPKNDESQILQLEITGNNIQTILDNYQKKDILLEDGKLRKENNDGLYINTHYTYSSEGKSTPINPKEYETDASGTRIPVRIYCDTSHIMKTIKIPNKLTHFILHINRTIYFLNKAGKSSAQITPNKLIKVDNTFFKLCGCILHQGGAGGGHYIYIVFNDNTMIQLNDSTISSYDNDKEIGKNGYLYLYEKIKKTHEIETQFKNEYGSLKMKSTAVEINLKDPTFLIDTDKNTKLYRIPYFCSNNNSMQQNINKIYKIDDIYVIYHDLNKIKLKGSDDNRTFRPHLWNLNDNVDFKKDINLPNSNKLLIYLNDKQSKFNYTNLRNLTIYLSDGKIKNIASHDAVLDLDNSKNNKVVNIHNNNIIFVIFTWGNDKYFYGIYVNSSMSGSDMIGTDIDTVEYQYIPIMKKFIEKEIPTKLSMVQTLQINSNIAPTPAPILQPTLDLEHIKNVPNKDEIAAEQLSEQLSEQNKIVGLLREVGESKTPTNLQNTNLLIHTVPIDESIMYKCLDATEYKPLKILSKYVVGKPDTGDPVIIPADKYNPTQIDYNFIKYTPLSYGVYGISESNFVSIPDVTMYNWQQSKLGGTRKKRKLKKRTHRKKYA